VLEKSRNIATLATIRDVVTGGMFGIAEAVTPYYSTGPV
jgi:hypothetical protein